MCVLHNDESNVLFSLLINTRPDRVDLFSDFQKNIMRIWNQK